MRARSCSSRRTSRRSAATSVGQGASAPDAPPRPLVQAVDAARGAPLLYLYPSRLDDALVDTVCDRRRRTSTSRCSTCRSRCCAGCAAGATATGSSPRIAIIRALRARRRVPFVLHRRLPGRDRGRPRPAAALRGGRPARLGRFFASRRRTAPAPQGLDGGVAGRARLAWSAYHELIAKLQDRITASRATSAWSAARRGPRRHARRRSHPTARRRRSTASSTCPTVSSPAPSPPHRRRRGRARPGGGVTGGHQLRALGARHAGQRHHNGWLASTPLFLAVVLAAGSDGSWLTVAVWFVLSCTDGVDGWLARRHGTAASAFSSTRPRPSRSCSGPWWCCVGENDVFWWVPVLLIQQARDHGQRLSLVGRAQGNLRAGPPHGEGEDRRAGPCGRLRTAAAAPRPRATPSWPTPSCGGQSRSR